MKSFIAKTILLITFTAHATGQRWVWSSRRSERQLNEPHRPPSSLPAGGAPLAAPAATPDFPPAAPLGLVPSASSLNPLGRPAVLESSFSVPVARPPVGLGPFQLRPLAIEPLVFRPLPIDISKLPLESSSGSDALEAEIHPPLSPLPLSSEIAPQDLTRSTRQGIPSHLEPITGIRAKSEFPDIFSNLNIRNQAPSRQPQAFVTSPDISSLPLQGSSSAGGSERFEGQPFPDNPTPITRFHLDSASPSTNRVLFPQKISSLAALHTGNDRLLEEFLSSQHSSVTPTPKRIIIEQPANFDESPFLKSKLTGVRGIKKALNPIGNGVQGNGGIIKFPQKDEKFKAFGGNVSPAFVIQPPNLFPLGGNLAAASESEVSSYSFLPGTSPLVSRQQPFQGFSELLRTDRAALPSNARTEQREFRPLTMIFKKHFSTKRGDNRVPSYVWLWPGQAKARRASNSFTSPAKHAL